MGALYDWVRSVIPPGTIRRIRELPLGLDEPHVCSPRPSVVIAKADGPVPQANHLRSPAWPQSGALTPIFLLPQVRVTRAGRQPYGPRRFSPQVFAVKLQQIEGVQEDVPPGRLLAQQLEHDQAVLVAGNRFAVDGTGPHLERVHRLQDEWIARCSVVAVAGEQTNADGVSLTAYARKVSDALNALKSREIPPAFQTSILENEAHVRILPYRGELVSSAFRLLRRSGVGCSLAGSSLLFGIGTWALP